MLYSQKQGHNVTGIDIDAKLVELCQRRGLTQVFEASFEDMGRFEVFDTILFMNRSIGIPGTFEGLKRLFALCHTATTSEVLLIFDSVEVRPKLANRGLGGAAKSQTRVIEAGNLAYEHGLFKSGVGILCIVIAYTVLKLELFSVI